MSRTEFQHLYQVVSSFSVIFVVIFQVCFLMGWSFFALIPSTDNEINLKFTLCNIEPLVPVYLHGTGATCIVAFIAMAAILVFDSHSRLVKVFMRKSLNIDNHF